MEYLSDGITQGIINRLYQLPSLEKVISWSSVRRYKAKEVDTQTLAAELGVRAILLADMTLVGEKVAVNAEMVNAQDGSIIWGERFSRASSGLFEMEEYFAGAIAEALGVTMTPAEKVRLTKRHTDNVEAYGLYLKGRHQYGDQTRSGFYKSIDYYKQALSMAPNFAQAHAGLADAYGTLWLFGFETPEEMIPNVKEELQKALDIDDDIADGHQTLAHLRFWYEWDWEGAEREYKKAIDLNPKDALIRSGYATFLACMGRYAKAIAQAKKAVELDPVSPETNRILAFVYKLLGQDDSAIERGHETLELASDYVLGYLDLGMAYVLTGKYNDGLAAFNRGLDLDKGNQLLQGGRAVAYALLGKAQKAREILDDLVERSKGGYSLGYNIAAVYCYLGEMEEAVKWLNIAYEKKNGLLALLGVDPIWDPLRDDPRFQDLLRRMNFPER